MEHDKDVCVSWVSQGWAWELDTGTELPPCLCTPHAHAQLKPSEQPSRGRHGPLPRGCVSGSLAVKAFRTLREESGSFGFKNPCQ